MLKEVEVPPLPGESFGEVRHWLVPQGALVEAGQPILVIETWVCDTNVMAPVSGRLSQFVSAGEVVLERQKVAEIKTTVEP